METVKLGEGKILVILTKEEADALGGVAEGAVSALLPGIVASGFASVSDTLTVELFESKDGGCQIFITREESGGMDYIKSGCSTDPSFFKRSKKAEPRAVSYRFCELAPLLCACRELSVSYRGKSSFASSDGSFYLTLSEDSPIPGEFGGTLCDAFESALLAERAVSSVDDAVTRLGAFAP